MNRNQWKELGVIVEADGTLSRGELIGLTEYQMIRAISLFHTPSEGQILPGEAHALASIMFDGFNYPATTFEEIEWKADRLKIAMNLILDPTKIKEGW